MRAHLQLVVAALTFVHADCDNEEHKYEVLVELYNLLTIGQSIIFVKVSTLVRVHGARADSAARSAATPPTRSPGG